MSVRRLPKMAFLLIVGVAAGSLLWLVDSNLGIGWPSNVLRNWQEFGPKPMHGALVFNPGGFQAVEHPQVYGGMSPLYLYPVYYCAQAFAWSGLGVLPFHLILAAGVFWGTCSLLGKGRAAFLFAVAILLSPGYGRWQKLLDPNVIVLLIGVPYAAILTTRLKQVPLRAVDLLIVVGLTALFIPLNWTSAWLLAPFGVFLLLSSGVRRSTAVVLLSLAAVGSIVSVLAAVGAKFGGHATDHSILGGYTWGNYGYGAGLTSGRAIVRVGFVTIVGLLPVLVLFSFEAWRHFRPPSLKLGLAFLPLAMVLLEIAGLRNYFGHHPWMSCPVVIVGLVFSYALMLDIKPISTPSAALEMKLPWAVAGACTLYGLCVLMLFRANEGGHISLAHFVRQNTSRGEWIVLLRPNDPVLTEFASRLDEQLDRRVLVVDHLSDLPAPPPNQPMVVLTGVAQTGSDIIASEAAGEISGGNSLLLWAGEWFNRHIARRAAGDRIDVGGNHFLYRPAAWNSANFHSESTAAAQ